MEKYTSLVCDETHTVSENKKKYSFILGAVLVVSVIAIGVVFLGSSSSQASQGFIETIADNEVFDKSTNLASSAVPVYRYHAINSDGSGWRFLYSLSSNFGQGWTFDQKVFLAYASAVVGSTPVYSHYQILSDGGWSLAYTTSSNPPSGFNFNAVAFWAYSSYVPNTKPIYQLYAYNSNGSVRYLYSDSASSTNGWTYQGLAFYAPLS